MSKTEETMNRKQRESNKRAAHSLLIAKQAKIDCPRCGKKGKHYFQTPYSLQDMMDGIVPEVLWLCKEKLNDLP